MPAFDPGSAPPRLHLSRPRGDCANVLREVASNTPEHPAKPLRRRPPTFLHQMPAEGSHDVVPPEGVSAMTARAADSIVRPLRLPITARWKNASRDACRFQ